MGTIRYIVEDTDESVNFYVQYLGLELLFNVGPYARVAKDDLTLWISNAESSAGRPMPDGRVPKAGGWNRFVLEVDDIESVVTSMSQAGVKFRNDITSGPGGKQILIEDPSGNPIELFQAG